jgi:hypothetical protein
VSLGLVNKVVRHLRDEGFVEDLGKKGLRLKDPRGLLDAWDAAYRFDRHQRLSYFTLLKKAELTRALSRLNTESGGFVAYASFSAAELQAPYVRQAKTWIYLTDQYLDALERHTEAKPVDSGENIVVLIPEDIGVFISFGDDSDPYVGEDRIGATDPAQTYIDLHHSGGRGEEAAQAILDQKLLPAWRAAGLP